jgi:hypothetical protein
MAAVVAGRPLEGDSASNGFAAPCHKVVTQFDAIMRGAEADNEPPPVHIASKRDAKVPPLI